MNLKAYKEKMNALLEERDTIENAAIEEVRGITSEERAKIEAIEEKVQGMEDLMAVSEEYRYDDSLKVVGNSENERLDRINNEVREFIQRGHKGTELRAAGGAMIETPATSMNKTSDHATIIPTNIANEIIKKMGVYSDIFNEVTKLPSVNGKLSITIDAADEDMASIVNEGSSFDDFKQLKFEAKQMDQNRFVGGFVLTQQLLNNSKFDLVSYATTRLAQKFAIGFENQIFNGDGSDTDLTKFRGVLKIANTTKSGKWITDITSTTKDTISLDDLNMVYTALHPAYLGSSKWYMNRDAYNKVCLLKDAVGHYYVQNGMVNGKLGKTLFGLPIVVSQQIPVDTPITLMDAKEAFAVMIKKDMIMYHIFADTVNAVQATHTLLADIYADGTVLNGQAIVRLKNKTS